MDCSTPDFPMLHHLPDFAQTHIHWVGDAIQPSHPLLSPSPPDFNLSQHQGLFQRVSSSHQVAKELELQLHHQFFQWIFRVDLFPLRFYSRKNFHDFPGGLVLKNPPANAGDTVSISAMGRFHKPQGMCATQLACHSCWALTLEPVLHNKRSRHNEKSAHRNRVDNCWPQLEKALEQQGRPSKAKRKKQKDTSSTQVPLNHSTLPSSRSSCWFLQPFYTYILRSICKPSNSFSNYT